MRRTLRYNKLSRKGKVNEGLSGLNAEPLTFGEWEKRIILDSIGRNSHNLLKVSRELKIGRTTLWRKMKKHNIQ